MLLSIGVLIAGLLILIVGGELLVKGAVGISKKLKISPLVIGMTVIAFGTSAPELIVSMKSALAGNPGIAIGNVVGSNIANLALVLGLTVLIFPIAAKRQTKILDYPLMLVATVLFYLFALDGEISLIDGFILLSILIIFVVYSITKSRKATKLEEAKSGEVATSTLPVWKTIAFLLLGIGGLFLGSEWFINGSVDIAEVLLKDNPDRDMIIGVTVVAFGTSAPELVASCVAAYRKQTDISVGNLIGSNLFNIMAVIGLTSIVQPIEVSETSLNFDFIWMLGISLLMVVVLFVGRRIGRIHGAMLLLSYLAYITCILLLVKGII